ncbi:MAG: hypothetical protein E5X61_04160 [Mesorhizobium sp.]|nr:MAG: hypothetical protein E5X61_04160 [Mesorhizobium sp.]
MNFREPNPFDKALRKIEFNRAMIWLIENVAQECAAVLGQRHAQKQMLNAHQFDRDAHYATGEQASRQAGDH